MPLIAAVPVRVRFSTLAPSVKLTALLHRVDAAGRASLDDDVAGIVDDIGVVAEPALHGVGAGAAVEDGWRRALPMSMLARPLPVPLIAAGCRSGSGSRHWRRA